jgi:hypothetical protein
MKNTQKENARRTRRTLKTRKGARALGEQAHGRSAIWGD